MSDAAIYLDYAATTPVDTRVVAAMQSSPHANPASIHVAGRRSAVTVAKARRHLADLLGTRPERLIFTSGATESDNLAISGAARFRAHRGKHLITMPTEHKAVVDTFAALERDGFEVTWLTPGHDGLLPIDSLIDAMREDTQLVSVMHVNNETGAIQDIAAIGAVCREHDVLFHTDAAQSVGKLEINLDQLPVDLLSLTAHKFHGPQGIGALYLADRPSCKVLPQMFGGGQERRLRPGTLPVPLVVGAGAAAALAAVEMAADREHATLLRERLLQGLGEIPDILHNSSVSHGIPGIVNASVTGVEGESLMLALEPVCVASGSACNATSGESSYVLRALGRSDEEAQSAIRFSFGRGTSLADIDRAVARLQWAIGHLRAMAPPHAAKKRA
jgi:cysteine desulfurase